MVDWSLGSTNFSLINGILVKIVDAKGIETKGTIQTSVTKIWSCYLAKDASI